MSKFLISLLIIFLFFALFCFAQEEELKETTNWLKELWYKYLYPWLQNIWQKIYSFLSREVEQRKPEVEQEFKKETQEMKEEIPKTGKSLWQRFKELIK